MQIEFTTEGNGTAFVREMDRVVQAFPPWTYGPDQIWNGFDDYRNLRRILGMAMRNGLSELAQESNGNSQPFVVEIFGAVFGFAPVPNGWLVGYLTNRTDLGEVYIGLIDLVFTSSITESKHSREAADVMEHAAAVIIEEQTEETLQDAEYLQMCIFLLKRFQRREPLRERTDMFINRYVELVGGEENE